MVDTLRVCVMIMASVILIIIIVNGYWLWFKQHH